MYKKAELLDKTDMLRQRYMQVWYSNHTKKGSYQDCFFVKSLIDAYKLINSWNIDSLQMDAECRYVFDQFDDPKATFRSCSKHNKNYFVERDNRGIKYCQAVKSYLIEDK